MSYVDISNPEDAPASTLTSMWSAAAAFGVYCCMYAYRKPFTVAAYKGISLWGVSYKTLLIIVQVAGYAFSKFIGIRIISEMEPSRRAARLVLLIATAECTLLLFAIVPPLPGLILFFVNGMALGLVFGLVLGFMEGRRHTEAMAAGLCVSFIAADGIVKTVGARLLTNGASDFWMPASVGIIFALPFLLFSFVLSRVPAPTRDDIAARSLRIPMTGEDRRLFLGKYAPGLVLVVCVYLLITVLRSLRSDFAPEIWAGLHATVQPDLFARSETSVGALVLLLSGCLVMVRSNRKAFDAAIAMSLVGTVTILVCLQLQRAGQISPFAFVVLDGLGLYLPYFAVHTTLFERLISMTRQRANIGYLMYLADAFGYLGYVTVLIIKSFAGSRAHFFSLFLNISWCSAILCVLLLIPCRTWFLSRLRAEDIITGL